MPEWIPINWKLLANPANWFIVILMITIAAFAAALLVGAPVTTSGDE